MYPSQPGETSEYVTSEEPSSFVDGESPRVEYNHLVESTSTTGSLSSTNVPVASASLTSMAPPDTFITPAASGGGAEAKLHSAVNDVGPEFEGKAETTTNEGEEFFSPPDREDSFGVIIDAPRAETDSFLVTSSNNPIPVGKVQRRSQEWHGFASQDAGRMN